MIYGRYSIGCWIDPQSTAACDGEEYFDDIPSMEAAVIRLLRGGKFKSIVTYEWDSESQEYEELDTYYEGDIDEVLPNGEDK